MAFEKLGKAKLNKIAKTETAIMLSIKVKPTSA
jgi:hypothetical protein